MRWSRRSLVLGGIAVALLLAGAGWWYFRGGPAASRPPASAGASPSAAVAAEAIDAANALESAAKDPDAVVAPGVIPSGQTAREGLSSAARVETHPETWRSDGFGGGTMTVTVTEPARPSVTYLVVLVHQEDGWKIAATYPVDTTSTPRP